MRLRKIYLTRRLTAPTTGGESPASSKRQSGTKLLTRREHQVVALVPEDKRSHLVAAAARSPLIESKPCAN